MTSCRTQVIRASGQVKAIKLTSFLASAFMFLLIIAEFAADPAANSANHVTAAQTQGGTSEVRANQVAIADQHEPSIAVDPTNPKNIITAAKDWRTGPKQVWYYRSTDGGVTWADGHVEGYPSELTNQSDPCLAFDSMGNVYLSVLGYNQNDFSIGGVFVARSTDMGVTWNQPIGVSANSDEVFNDKEWITVDTGNNPSTKGNVYVSWTQFTSESNSAERARIVVSRSTDMGKSFSPPVAVSPPYQTQTQGSFPTVGPNGYLYVLYYAGHGEEDDDAERGDADGDLQADLLRNQEEAKESLFISVSKDGGKTFSPARKAASVDSPPSPLPGSKFRMFVLPTLAVDPRNGTLYGTWNDHANGDADIMLVSSTDSGQTWGVPVRVNDDRAQTAHDQFFPTTKIGANGIVHLLWLDRRDDPSNLRYVPYYVRSTDSGRTFSKNLPVSSVSSDPDVGFEGTLIGDYISLDLSSDGNRVYIAWCDTREGNQDIYFAQFATQAGPRPVTISDQTSPTPEVVPSPQPLSGFTNESFMRTWERADRPVATGLASRGWLWGPVSFAAAEESYVQGSGGMRSVQYFDKARMEINNPNGNRSNSYYVTNGLLVVELVSGHVQTGDSQFEAAARPPSQVPVAGDRNSPDALTYASLAPVASLNNDNRAPDRTGQDVTATLDRSGQAGNDPTKAGLVKIALYDDVIGHNIPDVFWQFMNSTGKVYDAQRRDYVNESILNWTTDLGYPITEPYWTNVKISGVQKWVLVQAFQRRVLTYVPDNAPDWQVEMGNVGRHYFDWRY